MKTTFTYTEMQQLQGCYEKKPGKLNVLMDGAQQVTLSEILAWGIPTQDKVWFFCHSCELTQVELVSFATKCARLVLHIFEDEYPNDHRPRLAIEAAEIWVAAPSAKNTRAAAAAATAAARTAAAAAHIDDAGAAWAATAAARTAVAVVAAAIPARTAAAAAVDTDAAVDACILEIMKEMLRQATE